MPRYALADHLHRRGLYKNILHKLMSVDGKLAMRELSPSYIARWAGLRWRWR